MVVRAGTAMPTIWQAARSPSRGQVTIMGVLVRGLRSGDQSLLFNSRVAVVKHPYCPTLSPRGESRSGGIPGCGPHTAGVENVSLSWRASGAPGRGPGSQQGPAAPGPNARPGAPDARHESDTFSTGLDWGPQTMRPPTWWSGNPAIPGRAG